MRAFSALLCLFVLPYTSNPCWAQQTQVGVKAGLLTSTGAAPHSDVAFTARWGGVAGGFVRYSLGKRVALQAEVNYEQRGVTTWQQGEVGWEGIFGSYTREQRTRLKYGSVPLLVRGQVGHFFALAGPQLSYLLAARQQAQTGYDLYYSVADLVVPYPAEETSHSTREFRRWEVGYTAGVGYALGPHLALEVRYAAGLTELGKPYVLDPAQLAPPPQNPLFYARNRTWQAQISYQLRSPRPPQ